jgi:hypothetical protein
MRAVVLDDEQIERGTAVLRETGLGASDHAGAGRPM